MREELSEGGGLQVGESLKDNVEKFAMDVLRVGEPVEVFCGGGCLPEAVRVIC